MSKWDKLIEKLLGMSGEMRFDELCRILEAYGYEMTAPRSGSSHVTFRKKGKMAITIPRHEPIKRVYIAMVREIVEKEQNNGAN